MRYKSFQLTFQEVPNEISICFQISGCPLRCRGCHSVDTWMFDQGEELSLDLYQRYLQKHLGIATCVCFLGGEWHEAELLELLELAKTWGFKTCLYTGHEDVSSLLKSRLDYLKTGKYDSNKGDLTSPHTNQKFMHLQTGQLLNHFFHQQGVHHDSHVR